jgi:hypothetical protein
MQSNKLNLQDSDWDRGWSQETQEKDAVEPTVKDNSVGSDRRGVGLEAMLYATIEQAVLDCKTLQKAGIIVNGLCTKHWPRNKSGKPLVFSYDYDSPSPVNDLLVYLKRGKMEQDLKILGSPVGAKKILHKLGLLNLNLFA